MSLINRWENIKHRMEVERVNNAAMNTRRKKDINSSVQLNVEYFPILRNKSVHLKNEFVLLQAVQIRLSQIIQDENTAERIA